MLSKKTRYAMVALVRLAKEYGNGPMPISRIAVEEKIPQRFLEGILLELKGIGMLESTRGKTGGYHLLKHPTQISLAEIITIFEGSLGMLACVCSDKYRPCEFCKDETACKIRQTFRYVHESSSAILKTTTLQDLV
ncbi:MAG: Rrf2 family transcriptional regulator [Bacteroidales bacterium]|jgi:Rrf2 family protein|nr:Rrf2 family transcriptional regulator [Bacteroidales bacterium]